jgi:putative acetyltransferase
MTIRPARPEEAAAISALALRSKAYWGYSPAELRVFQGELTLAPEELGPRAAQVSEQEGLLRGFYTLLETPGGLELEHIFVDPEHLRRGLGSELLRHALRVATARGFAEVSVLSDPNAADFYRSHGARLEEEIPSSIPGRSIPRLVLPLPAASAVVRAERPDDHAAVFEVVEQAFGQRFEAELVEAIRSLHPSVSLVAESQGEVVAHVFFGPVEVHGTSGSRRAAMALAPLAVLPRVQKLGLGGLLVRAGLAACRELGEERVFVLGHHEYYPRFGFEPAAPRGLRYRSADFDSAFFVAELVAGALDGWTGSVVYPSAFDAA